MDEVLPPLSLLRNLPKRGFSIRDATLSDIPDFFLGDRHVPIFLSQLENKTALDEVSLLAQGNSPVEFAAEMYPAILKYAESYERYKLFKLDMNSENLPDTKVPPRLQEHFRLGFGNPFRLGGHPVEEALERAKLASEVEDRVTFKEERSVILEYLEPQYRRIVSTYTEVIEFIKREGTLRELNRALETSFYYDFKVHFISAFQDMELQFLEIRQSRKDLYKFDKLKEYGCEIGLQEQFNDEKVRFDVNEPGKLLLRSGKLRQV